MWSISAWMEEFLHPALQVYIQKNLSPFVQCHWFCYVSNNKLLTNEESWALYILPHIQNISWLQFISQLFKTFFLSVFLFWSTGWTHSIFSFFFLLLTHLNSWTKKTKCFGIKKFLLAFFNFVIDCKFVFLILGFMLDGNTIMLCFMLLQSVSEITNTSWPIWRTIKCHSKLWSPSRTKERLPNSGQGQGFIYLQCSKSQVGKVLWSNDI